MIDFTSRQLRAFLLVARYRNFTRAAEALFITPSGLSVLIRELETQIGFRLFDRTTRHVAPTTYGTELLAVAQKSLADLDTAVSHIGKSASAASQVISVGAAPFFAAYLPEAIKEFRVLRPDLQIRLLDVEARFIVQMVRAGKFDIGMVSLFGPAPGIRRKALFRYSLMVIRPDNNPAFRPATMTWSALKGESVLRLLPSGPVQSLINRHLARAGVVFHPNPTLSYLSTLIAMVEAGEGCGVIPTFALSACRNRRVVVSRLVNPVVSRDFYQISRRGKKLPPGGEEFTSFLQSYMARWAGRAGVL